MQSVAIIHNGARERLCSFGKQFIPLYRPGSGELYDQATRGSRATWLSPPGTNVTPVRSRFQIKTRTDKGLEIFLPGDCARAAKFRQPSAGLAKRSRIVLPGKDEPAVLR